MAGKADRTRTFRVTARVVVITDATVLAASLEEATERARRMRVTDFVKILGENIDYSYKIYSIADDGVPWTDDE